MIIKEIQRLEPILSLHYEIFGKEFPVSSYLKKQKHNKLCIFVYQEDSKLVGYSIVVDQEEKKNLYAWYGGVLPGFQGKNVTKIFFEKLISLATEKKYLSLTVATTNMRPHMITFAVKMGFDIYDVKSRDYGEGNKIYFIYNINTSHEEEINLSNKLKPYEIEEIIVKAYKNNCTTMRFTNVNDIDNLDFAIKYCNSFYRKPKIIIDLKHADALNCQNYCKKYNGELSIAYEK